MSRHMFRNFPSVVFIILALVTTDTLSFPFALAYSKAAARDTAGAFCCSYAKVNCEIICYIYAVRTDRIASLSVFTKESPVDTLFRNTYRSYVSIKIKGHYAWQRLRFRYSAYRLRHSALLSVLSKLHGRLSAQQEYRPVLLYRRQFYFQL